MEIYAERLEQFTSPTRGKQEFIEWTMEKFLLLVSDGRISFNLDLGLGHTRFAKSLTDKFAAKKKLDTSKLISCDDNDGFLAYKSKPQNKNWYDNGAIKVIK
jgi:hypothetical protein